MSRFWHVTLPLLSPTIFFAVVVGSIFAFQTFGQIDILTQGGPLKKTNVLTYFIFKTLRQDNNDGKAAVLAVALFFDHVRPHADPDAAARAAGALWPLQAAERGRTPSARRIVGQGRLRYLLLTVLAIIVLFPLYITVVNSLLTPSQITAPAAEVLPDQPAVGQLQRRVERRAHGPYLKNSFIVTFDHHRRPGRSPRSSPATRSRSSSSRSSARCSWCSSRR